jgi:arginine deiminase
MGEARVGVTSEIGRLEKVLCHTPGPELLAVTPATRDDFLYDDIIDLDAAKREHMRFRAILSRFAEVYEVRDLLEEVVEIPGVRASLIERVVDVSQSQPLGQELFEVAASKLVGDFIEGRLVNEGPLQQLLNVSSYDLPPLPNLFFTRDAAMVVGGGVIIGSMRYTARWTEEILMKTLFRHHPSLSNAGIVYDGSEERRAGYTLEGGDLHVLREDLVMIGLSERSSPAAFDVLAERLVRERGVRDILLVVIPADRADRAFIHLDMIFTMVDREHCVIFPPSFIGPTRNPVLHYRAGRAGMREMPDLFAALREVGLPLAPIRCGGGRRQFQEREQWTSGCNFVAVAPGIVLGYARNENTFAEMEREAGYRIVDALEYLAGDPSIEEGAKVVITFEGSELVRGGGGPRCMTMPVKRAAAW